MIDEEFRYFLEINLGVFIVSDLTSKRVNDWSSEQLNKNYVQSIINDYESIIKDQKDHSAKLRKEINSLTDLNYNLEKTLKFGNNKLSENKIIELENEYIRKSKALESEYIRKNKILESKFEELEEQKRRYTIEHQDNLQNSSRDFVKETVDGLREKEEKFSNQAFYWSLAGAFVLCIGLIFSIYITFINYPLSDKLVTWPLMVFYSLRGIIILTIVGFFTRYNFIQAGNYMQEALKISNRIHAIKFGQFYIETYGSTARWNEVKEAFASWNAEEKTLWEKNIHYDELNKNMKNIMSAVNNMKDSFGSKKVNVDNEKINSI